MDWSITFVAIWNLLIGGGCGYMIASHSAERKGATQLNQFVSDVIRQGRLDRKFAGMGTIGRAEVVDSDGVTWKITMETAS